MKSLSYLKAVAQEPAETYVDRSIANLREAMLQHPEDEIHLLQQLIIFLHIKDQEDETIGLALKLLEMDIDKIYAIDCFLILARMYARKEDSVNTIEYYRKAIATDPACYESIAELAAFYEKQWNFDEALAVYDHFDNGHFDDMKADTLCFKGTCYYNKTEYDKALECFQAALKIEGNNNEEGLNLNIGGCYLNLKNLSEAFIQFQKVLETNPQSATAHYGLGLCYQQTDDNYRAMHHYFEAIKLKPDYMKAYNNIAAVTINQEGDYKTGIDMLQKAIDNCPNEPYMTPIYLNLSRAYNALCEYEMADHYKAEYMKSLGFDGLLEEDDEEED